MTLGPELDLFEVGLLENWNSVAGLPVSVVLDVTGFVGVVSLDSALNLGPEWDLLEVELLEHWMLGLQVSDVVQGFEDEESRDSAVTLAPESDLLEAELLAD